MRGGEDEGSATVPDLSELPSVDRLLRATGTEKYVVAYGRALTVDALRQALDEARSRAPDVSSLPGPEELVARAGALLADWTDLAPTPVINATGVILHTNLGRAPLSPAARRAMASVADRYSNLEYDLAAGRRGSRASHAGGLLTRLTGAEDSLVVNNNAAAVLLVLTALARRKRVVIARTQLVEIGGGFRIPEVMQQSGARLVEIGTTNRVHLADYERALELPTAVILRAHRSNFRIVGFTSEPSLGSLSELAREADVPLADDLGSGSLLDTTDFGLGHEPMVQESLEAGADLVTFSGDKLLGGPQAGVIVGRAKLVAQLKRHPLARAVRADKLCLAALSATLLHYLKEEAVREVPVWRMIAAPVDSLEARARKWASALDSGAVVTGRSTVGGGSLPEESLPTALLALNAVAPDSFTARLRQLDPPIVARVEEDRVLFDPRTVLPEQEDALLEGLRKALSEEASE